METSKTDKMVTEAKKSGKGGKSTCNLENGNKIICYDDRSSIRFYLILKGETEERRFSKKKSYELVG